MSPVDLDNTSPDGSALDSHQDASQNAHAPSDETDLAAQYAAAQKEALEWKGRAVQRAEELNRLKKALVGSEDAPKPTEPKPATTEDLSQMKDEIRWELKNESQIEIADKNGKFSEYVKQGKSKQDALKLALFDEGISNSAVMAEVRRQAQASAPSAGIDRTGGTTAGIPEEVMARYQRRFPKMDKDKLAGIIKKAMNKDPDKKLPW